MTQSTAGETISTAPWVPDDSTFGARLALIRQHMRWTNVAQAARECGVPADSWRNWEEGMEPRRLVTIAMAIATKTGCDYLWLVHGPTRGGALPTTRFAPVARVLATVATPQSASRISDTGHGTRPVRQTRPLRSAAQLSPITV